jgi:hypothetical protein
LSFGDKRLNVVLTQSKSSARAAPAMPIAATTANPNPIRQRHLVLSLGLNRIFCSIVRCLAQPLCTP